MKLLAALIALVVAIPFVIVAATGGDLPWGQLLITAALLALLLGALYWRRREQG